jgi:hypothetical protein
MLYNSQLKYTSIYIYTKGVSKMLRHISKSFPHKNKKVLIKVCPEMSSFLNLTERLHSTINISMM